MFENRLFVIPGLELTESLYYFFAKEVATDNLSALAYFYICLSFGLPGQISTLGKRQLAPLGMGKAWEVM